MAERGQYILSVECDSDGDQEVLIAVHGRDLQDQPLLPVDQFVAATREAALAKARRAGWKFSWRHGRVTCPACYREYLRTRRKTKTEEQSYE